MYVYISSERRAYSSTSFLSLNVVTYKKRSHTQTHNKNNTTHDTCEDGCRRVGININIERDHDMVYTYVWLWLCLYI